MIKVVCELSIIDAPWTPSPLVSLVSSLHHHPHHIPQSGAHGKHSPFWKCIDDTNSPPPPLPLYPRYVGGVGCVWGKVMGAVMEGRQGCKAHNHRGMVPPWSPRRMKRVEKNCQTLLHMHTRTCMCRAPC